MTDEHAPSIEHPEYLAMRMTAYPQDPDEYLIRISTGRDMTVLCEGMSKAGADWLIGQLAHRPPFPYV